MTIENINEGQVLKDAGGPVSFNPKISIEIRPGRWGKIFHLFDKEGRVIALEQKDALKMARQILKEQNKK